MAHIDTRTTVQTSRQTYGGFVYGRKDDDEHFLLHILERWDGTPNDVKELQCPFTHTRDVMAAIDRYNKRVKDKETELLRNVPSTNTARGVNAKQA
jgi:hypothetical protein